MSVSSRRAGIGVVLCTAAAAAVALSAPQPADAHSFTGDPSLDVVETVWPAGRSGASLDTDSAGTAYVLEATDKGIVLTKVAHDGSSAPVGSPNPIYRGDVAVGPDDSVYLTSEDGIERIAPNGAKSVIKGEAFDHADSVAVGPDGNLWVDGYEGLVRRSPSGTVTKVSITNVSDITDLAVGPDGSLYILDRQRSRVTKRTPAGVQSVLVSLGTLPEDASGIDVDSAGTLRIAAGDTLIARASSGVVTRTSLDPFRTADAVSQGPDGTTFVLDALTGRVLVRDANADLIVGEIGPKFATDLALASDGAVWVTDLDLGLLRRDSEGTVDAFDTPKGWMLQSVAAGVDGSVLVGLQDENPESGSAAMWSVSPSGASSLTELTGITGMRDLALGADGTVYVADSADPGGRIVARSPAGSNRIVTTSSWPSQVAVGDDGTVYLADDGHTGGRTIAVSPLGIRRTMEIVGGWGGLAVDGAGNVYTDGDSDYDGDSGSPWVQSPGRHPRRISTSHIYDEASGTGLAVAPDGSVLTLADNSVVRYRAASPSAPDTPMVASVIGGEGSVTLAWSTPPDRGSAITGYEIVPAIDGVDQATRSVGATTKSTVIDGLATGTTYTFTVRANNGVGTSGPSSPSAAVTPGSPRYAPFTRWDYLIQRQRTDFTGSPGTAASRSTASIALIAGRSTPAAYIDTLRRSSWFHPHVAPVARLYLAYFQRTPDVGGLTYWTAQHRAGRTINRISATFAASSEFARTYGKLTDAAFVDLVYRNVLGRDADAGGRSYWTGKLAKGTSRGAVMASFSNSSEFVRATDAKVGVIELYAAMLHRSPTPSELASQTTVPISSTIDTIRLSAAYAATL